MAHGKEDDEKLIASNPSRSNYSIQEVVEAGIALQGTEVKSLRSQSPNLRDSFVEVVARGKKFEGWLLNLHIGPYSHGNIWNHIPTRKRKLLLHRHQLEKLYGAVIQKGMTIIPLRMYFKQGLAKLELGLGKGMKKYDKRDVLKKKEAQREMDKVRKHSL